MQYWAKRGLQTAMVTGGLFMLGNGIAAADENVVPDITPLDGVASAPAAPDVDLPDNPVNPGEITSMLTNQTSGPGAGLDATGLPSAEGLMPASGVPTLPSLSGDMAPATPAVPTTPDRPEVGPITTGHPQLPALPGRMSRSDVPDPLGLGFLEGIPGVNTELPPMPSAQGVGGVPALPSAPQGLSALPAPAERDLPTTEFRRVPGASSAAQSFHQNLQMPVDDVPEAGSLSGQLPLGGLASLGQTPAMSGLDAAELTGPIAGPRWR
ncbi:MAG: hypothetical protein ACRDQB_15685 [Thermocrispum sp.]